MSLKVRPARPADAAAMARAHARSWRATYTGLLPDAVIDEVVAAEPERVERWRARLGEPAEGRGSFVAEVDGRIVGSAFWGPCRDPGASRDTGEVYGIYLDPDVIGRGIGRQLFAAAVDALIAAGFARGVLWVLDTNRRARRFYEAAGWRPDGLTKVDERPAGVLHELRYARAFGETIETSD